MSVDVSSSGSRKIDDSSPDSEYIQSTDTEQDDSDEDYNPGATDKSKPRTNKTLLQAPEALKNSVNVRMPASYALATMSASDPQRIPTVVQPDMPLNRAILPRSVSGTSSTSPTQNTGAQKLTSLLNGKSELNNSTVRSRPKPSLSTLTAPYGAFSSKAVIRKSADGSQVIVAMMQNVASRDDQHAFSTKQGQLPPTSKSIIGMVPTSIRPPASNDAANIALSVTCQATASTVYTLTHSNARHGESKPKPTPVFISPAAVASSSPKVAIPRYNTFKVPVSGTPFRNATTPSNRPEKMVTADSYAQRVYMPSTSSHVVPHAAFNEVTTPTTTTVERKGVTVPVARRVIQAKPVTNTIVAPNPMTQAKSPPVEVKGRPSKFAKPSNFHTSSVRIYIIAVLKLSYTLCFMVVQLCIH